MQIFISGCAGFIGSKLTTYLLGNGYKVVGLDNFLYSNQQSILHLLGQERFKLIKEDVRDISKYSEFIKQSNIVILAHGLVGMPICDKNPEIAWQTNAYSVGGIAKLLSKEQRLIYLMTNSGYGTTSGEELCTEQTPLAPISIYGQSKVDGEKSVLEHSNSVSLRLATVFGLSYRPRFDLLVNDLFTNLYFDRQISLYEPYFMRNYVHIDDVVRAISYSIYQLGDKIYNVGNDRLNMSKLKLCHMICDYLSIDKSKIYIDETKKDKDKRNYQVSSKKITSKGFQFHIDLIDGFKELEKCCLIYNDKYKILSMGNSGGL